MKYRILILILLTALQSGQLLAQDTPPAEPPAPVRTEQSKRLEIAPVIWMPAVVIASQDSRLAAEVEGRLNFVAEVGDYLEQGAVVARVDTQTFRLMQSEAEATAAQITSRLAFNERELKRLNRLAAQNNAAKNRLDEVESLRNQARNELRAAKVRVEIARDRVNKAVLTAPFEGVVAERFKTPGERVDAGDEIIRLVNTGALEIQVSVPQSSIYHLKLGDELVARDSQHQVKGHIKALVPVGDARSRLYEVRIQFAAQHWAAGHLLRVAVPVEPPRTVIAVPRDALVIRTTGTSVYKVNETSQAVAVRVTTGIADGEWIEVTGDIAVGDAVITRGNERLRPGQGVAVQNRIEHSPQ